MISTSVKKEKVMLSELDENHYRRAISMYPYPRFHVYGVRKFLDRIFDIENDLDCDPQFMLGQGIARTIRKMPGIRIYSQSGQGERIYERI